MRKLLQNIDPKHTPDILDRINFKEGSLRVDDVLARLEVIRESMSRVDNASTHFPTEEKNENGMLLANAAYDSTTESNIDPWKRTISQMSMGSMMDSELTVCRVEVEVDGTTGPFYDRHRVYRISVSSAENNNNNNSGHVQRRYKDFCWIHDFLVCKYAFRTIPDLPPKKINGTHTYNLLLIFYVKLVTASEQTMVSRRRGLEEFLFLVANHPVLNKEALFIEFLTREDFSEVKDRIYPAWKDEFCNDEDDEDAEEINRNNHSESEVAVGLQISEPNDLIYKDAASWAKLLQTKIEQLRVCLGTICGCHLQISGQLELISNMMSTIFENTRHFEVQERAIPETLSDLALPSAQLIAQIGNQSLKLELFHRLITGTLTMIERSRHGQFRDFAKLSQKIVTQQAIGEKLRLRDGPNQSIEYQNVLRMISKVQREMWYQAKRNEFIQECLKQEVGWTVKMCKGLVHLFKSILSSFRDYHEVTANITSIPH